MSGMNDDNPLNQRFFLVPAPGSYVPPEISYQILAEEPDTIECWIKWLPANPLGMIQVFSLSNMNSKYVEKVMADKWSPNLRVLAREMIEGRVEVSFKHVVENHFKTTLTYFGSVLIGKMTHVTDIKAAKEMEPIGI
jgi:hypothetical protein